MQQYLYFICSLFLSSSLMALPWSANPLYGGLSPEGREIADHFKDIPSVRRELFEKKDDSYSVAPHQISQSCGAFLRLVEHDKTTRSDIEKFFYTYDNFGTKMDPLNHKRCVEITQNIIDKRKNNSNPEKSTENTKPAENTESTENK